MLMFSFLHLCLQDSDWSNPLAPVTYGKERQVETCPFFAKVGACRFGDRYEILGVHVTVPLGYNLRLTSFI